MRKTQFDWIALNRLQIEEPFFEAIVKADRCKEEMKLLGICLEYKSEIENG